MVEAILHLLIDHARAEIREAAGTTVPEAIEEFMAPFALAVRVIRLARRACRDIWVNAALGHRLGLVGRRSGLGNFFVIPWLGLQRSLKI
jgi:hypothetical protein